MDPTPEAYTELERAYDHFNRHLFEGRLPPCILTLQRKHHTYGYFAPKAFLHRGGQTTDEIAMNPEHFHKPIVETLQTLVHEMCHLWQSHFGNPGRARFHNREFASKMESIGLMPSRTGRPGGRKTGDQMMDYPIQGGLFEAVAAQLITDDFQLSWMDRVQALQEEQGGSTQGANGTAGTNGPKPDKSNRLKYRCPTCEVQVWGRPNLLIRCGSCPDGSLFLVTKKPLELIDIWSA